MPSSMDIDNVENVELGQEPFSPQSFDPEKIMAAFLMHRISKLSKEALADFASLGEDIAKCGSQDDWLEIAETIREILFPDELVGNLHEGAMSKVPSEHLEARKNWIGTKIKELREEAGFSQTDLASRSGLTQSHVSRLENGDHSPSNKTLSRIADALGKSVGDLDPQED